jgi:hypothetical protein
MEPKQAERDLRWERFAGLGGVVFGAILLVTFFLDTSPADDAPAQEWLSYMTEDTGVWVIYALLLGVGFVALVWCLGSVRSILARAEGGTGRLSTVVFGAGVLAIGLLATSMAFIGSTATATEFLDAFEADVQTGLALLGAGAVAFAFAAMAAGMAVASAAVVMLRTKTFPTWFAWASLVAGVAIFIGAVVDITFLLLPLWAIVIGVLIMGGVGTRPTPPREVGQLASTNKVAPAG